jgi:hypothetical protein
MQRGAGKLSASVVVVLPGVLALLGRPGPRFLRVCWAPLQVYSFSSNFAAAPVPGVLL